MEEPGDLGPVRSLGSEDSDCLLLPRELDFFGQGPLGPAQNDPGRFALGKTLPRPPATVVPFILGHKR